MLFGVLFVLAAAVLALWVDVRFPGLTPQGIQRVLVHLAITFVVGHLVSPILSGMVIHTGMPLARLSALMLVILPGLLYGSLCVIWLVKHAQDPLRSMMR
jgi:uncharacterized membrane protein